MVLDNNKETKVLKFYPIYCLVHNKHACKYVTYFRELYVHSFLKGYCKLFRVMKCFQFYIGKKKGELKMTTLNSVQSSFADQEVRPSGSEFNSQNVSDTSTESRGRSQFPNLSERPSNLKVFTFLELKQATKNFSRSAKLGEGGFGCVFKGVIRDSQDPTKKLDIAVKQLGPRGMQAGSLSF